MREGFASTLVSYSTKCEETFLLASTPKVSIGGSKSSMYDGMHTLAKLVKINAIEILFV